MMSPYEEILAPHWLFHLGQERCWQVIFWIASTVKIKSHIDSLWADEIERRIKEIDEGKVTPIPGEEVMARLRARRSRK